MNEADLRPDTTSGSPQSPLDLAYLRRQICDDQDLEAELLELFSAQARRIVGDLALVTADAADDRVRRSDLLHTLCGSARAIGAWEVATEANELERIERTAREGAAPPRIGLERAVTRACAAIGSRDAAGP